MQMFYKLRLPNHGGLRTQTYNHRKAYQHNKSSCSSHDHKSRTSRTFEQELCPHECNNRDVRSLLETSFSIKKGLMADA